MDQQKRREKEEIERTEGIPFEEGFENLRFSKEGLTSNSAAQRLELFGYNKLEEKKERKLLKFFGFMWNPLSWVMEASAIMATVLANGGFTINPLKETELIIYGGEFYNGNKTFVYGDLYRYDVEKQEWKLVSSPNSPPPRSAHQAVAWKNYWYIFGGEFTPPNEERFHHYKDFWVMGLKMNQWEQLNYKGCPSPRSGHRMNLYKHKIIVFGGFYDTLREVRYFNDLHVFDLDQFKGPCEFVMLNVDNTKWEQELDQFGVEGIQHFAFLDREGNEEENIVGRLPRQILLENVDALARGEALIPHSRVVGPFSTVESRDK